MNPNNIHVKDPVEVKACMQAVPSLLEEYCDVLKADLYAIDEVWQLGIEAKRCVQNRCLSLENESQWSSSDESNDHDAIRHEIEECLLLLNRLDLHAELLDGLKRDSVSAINRVNSLLEEANGAKARVDALMDLLIDSR